MEKTIDSKLNMTIENEIKDIFAEIVEIRRNIHMHPCTGMDTEETEEYVRKKLQEYGIETLTSNCGVLGMIKGKDDSRIVALRADMDALPLEERTNAPYRSIYENKMHACGHDAHTAMLLGAAKILNRNRGDIDCDVLLVFQPSEEGPIISGAKEILKDIDKNGLSDKIVAMFGQHVFNSIEVGTAGTKYGSMSASTDVFDIVFTGRGGHCSRPHVCIDALSLGAKFVNEIESFMSRRIDPLDNAICAIGTFNSGSANNIVAETAKLSASVRCQRETTRSHILQSVDKIAKGICETWGGTYELKITRGLPVLVNDEKTTNYAMNVMKQVLGGNSYVNITEPMMGAEDFAYYAERFPTTFVFLGTGNTEKGIIHENHNPHFDIDEDGMVIGVKIFCNLVFNCRNFELFKD